uniref:Serpin domain-containing protein n=1 Tax=Percolomonas cosmopolitus TaxID=63605 RepID=A0A7S1PJ37_9EUKA|mmetsp:Transcript_5604/g.21086  ORF Transcript_5604/g.21086 Transcript_5604/m.21086 type:complete len:477 (+) Transcript_5604:1534-2964(+)
MECLRREYLLCEHSGRKTTENFKSDFCGVTHQKESCFLHYLRAKFVGDVQFFSHQIRTPPQWHSQIHPLRTMVYNHTFPENVTLPLYALYPNLGTAYYVTPLIHQVMPQETQIIYSPFAILLSLCLAALGASGNSYDEIQSRFVCQPENVKYFLEAMRNESNAFSVTNAMFPSTDYSLTSDFADYSSQNYAPHIEKFDYYSNVPDGRSKFNQRVKELTDNHLKHGLVAESHDGSTLYTDGSEETLAADTSNVLVSGMWVDNQWLYPFPAYLLAKGNFSKIRREDDVEVQEQVETTYMRSYAERLFRVADYGDGIEGISLPMATEGLEMIIVKPTNHSFEALSQAEDRFFSYDDHNSTWKVYNRIELPRFKVESVFDMKPRLKRVGIQEAFDTLLADFSMMFTTRSLLSHVFTWSSLSVNENGIHGAYIPETIEFPVIEIPKEAKRHSFVVDGPFLVSVRYFDETLLEARILEPEGT